jgi:flagellar motor switch protein FliM
VARQLTQQEIDAVFRSAEGPKADDTAARRAVPFDFRRPDRIAKSQLRAIHLLHENFVRNLASSLSAYLRSYLTVNLISVEQLSYGEFLEGLPSPTCLVSTSLKPYDGNALIELNPSVVFPILEIILGGKGKAAPTVKREITDIEQTLLDGLFRIILGDLREAWKGITAIDFRAEAVATEPQMLQILASNEAVVAVATEIRIGDSSGTLNMAIPSINIKMIGQKFDQQWSLRKAASSVEEQARMLRLVRKSSLKVETVLKGPRMLVEDLLGLEEGDVVMFDYAVERPLTSVVNGVPKFTGRIISNGNRKAFRIEDRYKA